MYEQTIKSYKELGVRIQFVKLVFCDGHWEFEVRKNRKRIYHGNAVAFDYALSIFKVEVLNCINQTKLFY